MKKVGEEGGEKRGLPLSGLFLSLHPSDGGGAGGDHVLFNLFERVTTDPLDLHEIPGVAKFVSLAVLDDGLAPAPTDIGKHHQFAQRGFVDVAYPLDRVGLSGNRAPLRRGGGGEAHQQCRNEAGGE